MRTLLAWRTRQPPPPAQFIPPPWTAEVAQAHAAGMMRGPVDPAYDPCGRPPLPAEEAP